MPGRDLGAGSHDSRLRPLRDLGRFVERLPRRRVWPTVRLLVGAVILVALIARLGADAFVEGFRAIDPGAVLAALGIGLATTIFSAWRWCLVARGFGLQLPLQGAIADYYRASFLNSVLPAGVLGDVHRALSHGKRAGDVGGGVRAVALERAAGLAVLIVVGVAVLVFQPTPLAIAVGDALAGRASATVLVLGLAAVVLVAWLLRGAGASRFRRALRASLAAVRGGLLGPGAWLGVVALSLAALAGYLAMFVVAARAAGSHATLGELLPLLVLALLAMGLPVNIGGWGPREGVAAVAFGAVGFGATLGLTVAVVYGVLSLISCLPGLGVLVLRRSRRVGRPAGFVPAVRAQTSNVAGC
jgi:glycosyltransferase 2 family protein